MKDKSLALSCSLIHTQPTPCFGGNQLHGVTLSFDHVGRIKALLVAGYLWGKTRKLGDRFEFQILEPLV